MDSVSSGHSNNQSAYKQMSVITTIGHIMVIISNKAKQANDKIKYSVRVNLKKIKISLMKTNLI